MSIVILDIEKKALQHFKYIEAVHIKCYRPIGQGKTRFYVNDEFNKKNSNKRLLSGWTYIFHFFFLSLCCLLVMKEKGVSVCTLIFCVTVCFIHRGEIILFIRQELTGNFLTLQHFFYVKYMIFSRHNYFCSVRGRKKKRFFFFFGMRHRNIIYSPQHPYIYI